MEPHRGVHPSRARQAPRGQAAWSGPELHRPRGRCHSGRRSGWHGHRAGQGAGLHLSSRFHRGQPPRRQVPSRRRVLAVGRGRARPGRRSRALTTAGLTSAEAEQGTDAGEALRARILQQAEQQQASADAEAKAAAEKAAAETAAAEAKKQQDAAEAEAAAKKKAAEEAAKKKKEAERLAKLAASFSLPTFSYTITSTYGQSGALWSSGQHTGLDFAGSAGAPLKAVHSGTITSAGYSGSYGYRTVLELEDGTEIWYAHQSSIEVSVGQKVTTGQTIGRMGDSGNVTGVHLHLEVRTAGGSAMDPMAWLNSKGLNV